MIACTPEHTHYLYTGQPEAKAPPDYQVYIQLHTKHYIRPVGKRSSLKEGIGRIP